MTTSALLQLGLVFAGFLLPAIPLGAWMARVFADGGASPGRLLGPLERAVYRVAGVEDGTEMTWLTYTRALLAFNLAGFAAVYLLQRIQGWLPLNPEHLGGVEPTSALNTAVSFMTNTNWQGYGGETTMSYLTEMLGMTVQNFVSAATGIAVAVALARGLARRQSDTIGNFWRDLVRAVVYVLLPLSLVMALVLVSQGVVQTLRPYADARLLEPIRSAGGAEVATQRIALGPAASQVAIKQLGTNGGGFFNANSAHPFENPTPLTNLLETVAILLLPAALCLAFGDLVHDRRQGWALIAAMLVVLVPATLSAIAFEQAGNPALAASGVDQAPSPLQCGGNMEGKEVRFGIGASATWAAFTTAASNGSVDAMHDSLTPLGGLVTLGLIDLGEVIFGGVGAGLYGILVIVVIAVFSAGLLVGRTPEYIGKKIGPFETKMAAVAILAMPIVVLVGTAVAVVLPAGTGSISNPGPHGFSQVLYAFSSAGNNNGSAFAGLAANTPFYNLTLGLAMLVGRFLIIVPVLALAGSLAAKKAVPVSAGTLPTHSPLFIGWLVAVLVIVGLLTFFPALALGPVVEHLALR